MAMFILDKISPDSCAIRRVSVLEPLLEGKRSFQSRERLQIADKRWEIYSNVNLAIVLISMPRVMKTFVYTREAVDAALN